MRHSFFLILLIIAFSNSVKAQDSGISFEVQYPLIFSDENSYPNNVGMLGGSLQYQFTDGIPFNFGMEYKFDLFQTTEKLSEFSEHTKRNFLISNINLYSKMLFITLPQLQLYTTGGFTVYKYKNTGVGRSFLGFNVGAGITYDIFDKIYVVGSYSYIKATLNDSFGNPFSKDEHQLIRVGFGFKL